MTTYRPGAASNGRSKHARIAKNRDVLFSDEANANTDWIPCQAGDTINLMAHAAQLRRRVNNGAVVADTYDVVRLNSSPVGTISLKHKLGGEADEHAALLGSWTDTIVVYNQPIQMRGFIRVEFGCMEGQQINQHTDDVGMAVTPSGIHVSVEVA